MYPPLVLDIDGTLTRPGHDTSPAPIDPRIFEPLYQWDAPVILATGKAFPFPIALGQFIGLDRAVIAENGGIACYRNEMTTIGDGAAATRVRDRLAEAGIDTTHDRLALINRWRETEVAFRREVPRADIERVAGEEGLHVVDTGFAYHVKDPGVTKGRALEWIVQQLGVSMHSLVAVGDSVNDVSLFERVGRSFAVANADGPAKDAADTVLTEASAEGLLAVLERITRD